MAASGAQWTIQRGNQSAVIVEVGGGLRSYSVDGEEIVDGYGEDEMAPGAAFPLHVHEGDHILYILEGRGSVHVGGIDHPAEPGDTLFIPAALPHGVKADPACPHPFVFLAVGYPHRRIESPDRMTVIETTVLEPPRNQR